MSREKPLQILLSPKRLDLLPAYNPIKLTVLSYNPIVYCDVYFGVGGQFGTTEKYYKTLVNSHGTNGAFEFDIQDAAQEYLKSIPLPLNTPGILEDNQVHCTCYVRFREGYDIGGVIMQQTPIPVQATSTTPAIEGGGVQSDSFFILNARLQHDDRQELLTHLSYFIRQSPPNGFQIYPLSHRPDGYQIRVSDHDRMAIYVNMLNNGAWNMNARIIVQNLDTGTQYAKDDQYTIWIHRVYYIPTSPASIDMLSGTSIPWGNIRRYRVILRVGAFNAFYSPEFHLVNEGIKERRIRFVNHLGTFDSIILKDTIEKYTTKSDRWKKLTRIPSSSNRRNNASLSRYNVETTRETTVIGYFPETFSEWIRELLGSPIALIEWRSPIQGQFVNYTPIVITDGEAILIKNEDDYEYQTVIKYELSVNDIVLRN